jgi:hypothetical protein
MGVLLSNDQIQSLLSCAIAFVTFRRTYSPLAIERISLDSATLVVPANPHSSWLQLPNKYLTLD